MGFKVWALKIGEVGGEYSKDYLEVRKQLALRGLTSSSSQRCFWANLEGSPLEKRSLAKRGDPEPCQQGSAPLASAPTRSYTEPMTKPETLNPKPETLNPKPYSGGRSGPPGAAMSFLPCTCRDNLPTSLMPRQLPPKP